MAANKKMNGKRRLRSREWFDAGDLSMQALYLERYMNFGLTLAELHSGRPIIGIAQTGSDLSPCNRHHLQLADRVRDGIRDAGGIPIEFPGASHPGDRQAADAGARPKPVLSQPGREPLWLLLRRCRADHRLRQDHAGHDHGCGDGQHSRHRAVWWANARRALRRRTGGFGHHRLVRPPGAGGRAHRHADLPPVGRRQRPQCRPLQHHGHRALDEQHGRGARHVAARLCGHPRPVPRAWPDRLRDRQAHRRHGVGGPQAFRHPDSQSLRQCNRGGERARRLDQLPAARQRHRAPHRRQAHQQGLGQDRLRYSALGELHASRQISGRSLPSCGRRAHGHARAVAQEEDPWRRPDRHRQELCGEPQERQVCRRRSDQDLLQAHARQGRLCRAVGQSLRTRRS